MRISTFANNPGPFFRGLFVMANEDNLPPVMAQRRQKIKTLTYGLHLSKVTNQVCQDFLYFVSEKMFSYTFISALLGFVIELVISAPIYVVLYLLLGIFSVLQHGERNGQLFVFTYRRHTRNLRYKKIFIKTMWLINMQEVKLLILF